MLCFTFHIMLLKRFLIPILLLKNLYSYYCYFQNNNKTVPCLNFPIFLFYYKNSFLLFSIGIHHETYSANIYSFSKFSFLVCILDNKGDNSPKQCPS